MCHSRDIFSMTGKYINANIVMHILDSIQTCQIRLGLWVLQIPIQVIKKLSTVLSVENLVTKSNINEFYLSFRTCSRNIQFL